MEESIYRIRDGCSLVMCLRMCMLPRGDGDGVGGVGRVGVGVGRVGGGVGGVMSLELWSCGDVV